MSVSLAVPLKAPIKLVAVTEPPKVAVPFENIVVADPTERLPLISNDVNVPNDVNEEAVTPELRVDPVKLPAGKLP